MTVSHVHNQNRCLYELGSPFRFAFVATTGLDSDIPFGLYILWLCFRIDTVRLNVTDLSQRLLTKVKRGIMVYLNFKAVAKKNPNFSIISHPPMAKSWVLVYICEKGAIPSCF